MARPKSTKPKPGNPPFTVKLRGASIDDLRALNRRYAKAVREHIEHLRKRGCGAAGYRLSGSPPWNHLCSTHIGPYRVIVAFPSENEVVVLKVARHDDRTDPYREIAEEVGLELSTEPRTKPSCCDGDVAPLDPDFVDRYEAAFSRLTQRERKARAHR